MPGRASSHRRHRSPEAPNLRTLGDRIRAARVEAGLSQAALGAPHFTRAYVSAVELGKIRPSMAALEFLARRLGREPGALLEDARSRTRARERELALLRARELLESGHPGEAAQLLRRADESGEARALLARALAASGAAAAALPLLEDALRRASSAEDPEALVAVRRDLAGAHRALGDRTLALEHAAHAVDDARSASADPLLLARALRTRASIELELGEARRAVASLEEALEACGGIEDPRALARVHSAAAGTSARAGDAERAVRALRRAVLLLESVHDLSLAAELRTALESARAAARKGPPRPSRRSATEASS